MRGGRQRALRVDDVGAVLLDRLLLVHRRSLEAAGVGHRVLLLVDHGDEEELAVGEHRRRGPRAAAMRRLGAVGREEHARRRRPSVR